MTALQILSIRASFHPAKARSLYIFKKVVALSLLTGSLFGCGRPALDKPAQNALSDSLLTQGQLDSIYQYTQRFPNHSQIAFALIRNGQLAYYGIQRQHDTLQRIQNSNRVFEIGSITKVFTTTILASYAVEGKLKLDDQINPYFDFPFHDQLQFSFRELANHSSGLPRLPSNLWFSALFHQDDPYRDYDESKLDAYLKNDVSLDYPKGTKSEYSNLGMGLLSYTLRRYSGRSFEELARERIFDKLGMAHSSTDKSKVAPLLLAGLDEEGKPGSNWSPGALIGAGGIYSSVEDLSRFALAHFDSTRLELALTREKTFQETENRDVGLGWFIIKRKNGEEWFWHNGGTGAYSSSMLMDVKNKNAVIVLTNISSYHQLFENVDKLCFSLMKSFETDKTEPVLTSQSE